jgi:IclR family acetate operon transcriptional repressor
MNKVERGPGSADAEREAGDLQSLVTVERTMRIFEILCDDSQGVPVSDIARELQVNKSIAFRILATLKTLGYVYQNPENSTYRMTFRLSNLGLRQQASARLTDQCFPIVRSLADETGELVRLAVIEAGMPIWIHAASGPQRRLRIDPTWEAGVVDHTHAAGKAWLSTLPVEEVERIIGSGPYPPRTPYTKTTLDEVLRDLERAREMGFAISFEEHEIGVGAIATPIMVHVNGTSQCAGVLSVAAPTSRVDRESITTAGAALLRTRQELELAWPIGTVLLP